MVFSTQMMNLWGQFLVSLTWVMKHQESSGCLCRGCWTSCICRPNTKDKKHNETPAAWPKGPRKFKAAEHWPQIFVYFTQSVRDKVSGGQVRAGGGFPGVHCPEATTTGQSHIPVIHIHTTTGFLQPNTTLNPRLVFPAYRGNTNNPKALGKEAAYVFLKCEEGTAAATSPGAGVGTVGLPTERGPRFLHTPNTRYCNSFYKQMADARLEKIKVEKCWGKGLSAPLGRF